MVDLSNKKLVQDEIDRLSYIVYELNLKEKVEKAKDLLENFIGKYYKTKADSDDLGFIKGISLKDGVFKVVYFSNDEVCGDNIFCNTEMDSGHIIKFYDEITLEEYGRAFDDFMSNIYLLEKGK